MTASDVSLVTGSHLHWKPLLSWKRECPSVVESVPSSMSSSKGKAAGGGGSDASTCTFDGESISSEGSSEFVIQCEKNEMVFVTSAQGRMLRKRSVFFRELFAVGSPDFEDRVVRRPEWSVAAIRRLIELITTGFLWIENDASVFSELVQVAEKLSVGLRLGSLINYHDVLDEHDTKRFFQLVNIDKYQFKIQVTIKSWQWMDLMRQGVLLLPKAKVLMMKLGTNASDATIATQKPPTYDRLNKCDNISSEFCVYANGKLNVLLKILEVLSPPTSSKDGSGRTHQQEMFRITYLTKAGGLSQDEMNMLWRITAASYTTATPDERKYLNSSDPKKRPYENMGEKSFASTNPVPVGSAEKSSGDHASLVDSGSPDKENSIPASVISTSLTSVPPTDFHCRTITCNSFLVLKHVFESINKENGDLPACLLVNAPTPDTLGRLINAGRLFGGDQNEVGMDVAENLFYAAKSSTDIKRMLGHLSDYSTSAVVKEEFKLVEFQQMNASKGTK